jgi:hypothetical protein
MSWAKYETINKYIDNYNFKRVMSPTVRRGGGDTDLSPLSLHISAGFINQECHRFPIYI